MSPPTHEDLVRTIRRSGVSDARVLEAVARVDRAGYVPAGVRRSAHVDEPVPIGEGQVTSQPSLVARMVAALDVDDGDRVLELGTGHGYQTALLASLAREVWSVERFESLADAARENLAADGFDNTHVVRADGSEGLPEHAPYDAIVVSAAHPHVPPPLAEQLAEGGRLVQPIGSGGSEEVVLYVKQDGVLRPRDTVSLARFVRMYGHHGFPESGGRGPGDPATGTP